MSIPTVTTQRLTLRSFTAQDVDPLHRILAEPDALRYFPHSDPPSRERVQRLVSRQLEHWQEHGYGWWAVELQGEFIGWCGLQYLPETDEVEVAYLLAKPYWGRGLASEGAQASLRYGFEELGLRRIVGIVHSENKASQRVLEKSGLRFVERAHYFGMDCYRYLIEHSSPDRRSG